MSEPKPAGISATARLIIRNSHNNRIGAKILLVIHTTFGETIHQTNAAGNCFPAARKDQTNPLVPISSALEAIEQGVGVTA